MDRMTGRPIDSINFPIGAVPIFSTDFCSTKIPPAVKEMQKAQQKRRKSSNWTYAFSGYIFHFYYSRRAAGKSRGKFEKFVGGGGKSLDVF
jgi:hypothetical protein